MTKMPVIFTGHGSPMIALEKNDLTRTFHDLGKEIIDTFGRPKPFCLCPPTGTPGEAMYSPALFPGRFSICTDFPKSSMK